MTKDEALDLALEIMHNQGDVGVDEWMAAEAAIKQARSAPAQKPVWIRPDHLQKAQRAPFLCRVEPNKRDDFVPLYTTPPTAQRQWVGLTDEEITALKHNGERYISSQDFARAIEAKLKELNT